MSLKAIENKIMQDQIEINNSLIKNYKQKQKKIINFNSLILILYLYF